MDASEIYLIERKIDLLMGWTWRIADREGEGEGQGAAKIDRCGMTAGFLRN